MVALYTSAAASRADFARSNSARSLSFNLSCHLMPPCTLLFGAPQGGNVCGTIAYIVRFFLAHTVGACDKKSRETPKRTA